MMYEYMTERWELLIFETAEEYIKRKKKEKKWKQKHDKEYNREIAIKGVCDGCGEKKENLRWIMNNEFYSCYECFMNDLRCRSDVEVPYTRADYMEEYVSEALWDELCESDNNKRYCDICKYSSFNFEDEYYCEHRNGLVDEVDAFEKCYEKK
jgi:hypothetical protein